MAGPNAPDPRMDVNDLYREDTYSDRKVGTIRVMTPVKSDGSTDPARASIYVGQAQIMTPAGVLPLSFEIPATNLGRGLRGLCRRRQDRFRRNDEGTAGDAPAAGVVDRDSGRRRGRRAGPGRTASWKDPVPLRGK